MRVLLLSVFLMVIACVSPPQEPKPEPQAPLILKPADFNDLPGWQTDDLKQAASALKLSCARILKNDPQKTFGPLKEAGTYGDWFTGCKALTEAIDPRSVLETYFKPYQVFAGTEEQGLFTGYYEASLRGSKTKTPVYNVPLYQRPEDLVMVDLGEFREELKGQRIAGRVVSGNLKPYEDRAQIVRGQWPHNDKVLVWVDDPIDAFFVQIQGSGVVRMEDGSVMRIGYAGQNGHVYYAIGRELVQRGAMKKEDVSMQSIRAWLKENPELADKVMNTNRSYVFFKSSEQAGAIGGEGVVLTPERSLAIDRSLLPYGIPLWVDIEAPIEAEKPIQRLMIAQDTGGAIRGPVRGDVFWGYGPRAEQIAGEMKAKGRYWILLPQT